MYKTDYENMCSPAHPRKVMCFTDLKDVPGLKLQDISTEEVREYSFDSGNCYTIENPIGLYTREGGSTHRVVDAMGWVHCVPFSQGNVVVRWLSRRDCQPVAF